MSWIRFEAIATRSSRSEMVGSSQQEITQPTHERPAQKIIVARYHEDGTLDPSFGNAGVAMIGIGKIDVAEHLFIRSDERIVIGATVDDAPMTIRLLADGNLDTTFADQGRAINFEAQVMQPNGELLGTVETILQRRSPRGLLDRGFGNGGRVDLMTDPVANGSETPKAIVVQPDGKIILVSTTDVLSEIDALRFLPNGQPDTPFGAPSFSGDYYTLTPFLSVKTAISRNGDLIIAAADDNARTLFFDYGPSASRFHAAPQFEHFVEDLLANANGRIEVLYSDGVQQLMSDGSPDIRFDAGNISTLGGFSAIAIQNMTGQLLATGTSGDVNGIPHPAVFRINTTDDGFAIQKFAHGSLAFYGTNGPDQISVKRHPTTFDFSFNGISRTFLRSDIKRIYAWGNGGDDSISIDGKGASVSVYGGAGNDTINIPYSRNAYIERGDGNDFISATGLTSDIPFFAADVVAYGGQGNDHIIGVADDTLLVGNAGNDTLEGTGGTANTLYGQSGDDTLITSGGITSGGSGNNTIISMHRR